MPSRVVISVERQCAFSFNVLITMKSDHRTHIKVNIADITANNVRVRFKKKAGNVSDFDETPVICRISHSISGKNQMLCNERISKYSKYSWKFCGLSMTEYPSACPLRSYNHLYFNFNCLTYRMFPCGNSGISVNNWYDLSYSNSNSTAESHQFDYSTPLHIAFALSSI